MPFHMNLYVLRVCSTFPMLPVSQLGPTPAAAATAAALAAVTTCTRDRITEAIPQLARPTSSVFPSGQGVPTETPQSAPMEAVDKDFVEAARAGLAWE